MKIQYMKTKLLLLLILISASGFSQVIYSDEFDQGINNLNGNNRLTTSIENNNLKIVGNGTSGQWENIRYAFHNNGTNMSIDASSSPKIFIKVKAENSPTIRVDFVDVNGYSTSQHGLSMQPGSDFQIFELNYTNKLIDGGYGGPCSSGPCDLDGTQLEYLAFYFNPGTGGYSGTVEIEWISIGESLEVEPPLHLKNAKVVGYLPDYRFAVSNQIDYTKLTHLMLCFANPDSSGNLIMADISQVVSDAKAQNPNIVIMISLAGGLNHGSATANYWSNLIDNAANRPAFIAKIVDYVLQNNLDGVDVDLEFDLVTSGYSPFVIELDAALDAHNKLITAALPRVYYNNLTQTALEKFDFINLMAYDATGFWGSVGQHSSYEFAEENINFWKTTGQLSGDKLVLGVPFYGHNFDTQQFVTYGEMVQNNSSNADVDQVGNTYYNGRPTIEKKVQLAYDKVGGIMIWELAQDSFTEYSLLSTIHEKYTALDVTTTGLGTNASTLSLDEETISNTDVVAYPNPVKDYLNIIPKNLSIDRIEVYDLLGKRMASISKPNGVIPFTEYSPGIYLVKINTPKGRIVKRILKK